VLVGTIGQIDPSKRLKLIPKTGDNRGVKID